MYCLMQYVIGWIKDFEVLCRRVLDSGLVLHVCAYK